MHKLVMDYAGDRPPPINWAATLDNETALEDFIFGQVVNHVFNRGARPPQLRGAKDLKLYRAVRTLSRLRRVCEEFHRIPREIDMLISHYRRRIGQLEDAMVALVEVGNCAGGLPDLRGIARYIEQGLIVQVASQRQMHRRRLERLTVMTDVSRVIDGTNTNADTRRQKVYASFMLARDNVPSDASYIEFYRDVRNLAAVCVPNGGGVDDGRDGDGSDGDSHGDGYVYGDRDGDYDHNGDEGYPYGEA